MLYAFPFHIIYAIWLAISPYFNFFLILFWLKEIMKFLIMHFSPTSCYILPLKIKYSLSALFIPHIKTKYSLSTLFILPL